MMKGWLAKAGPYKIERIPCRDYAGDVDVSAPATGVLHTTEGGSWDGLIAEFKGKFAPHFLVGPGRIAQLLPLGRAAAALKHPDGAPPTNGIARVQIEVIGFSQTKPYSFDLRTRDALAMLLAVLSDSSVAGIPLARPFTDDMPAQPWATTSFPRRLVGKWGKVAGWYGHVEVPNNSHWDPGALQWTGLLSAARKNLSPTGLAALKGYYAWRDWYLAIGLWTRRKPQDPRVRPNVPKRIPVLWWFRLRLHLR